MSEAKITEMSNRFKKYEIKTYKTTFSSVAKLISNVFFASVALLFHLPIGLGLCFITYHIPLSPYWRRSISRSIKVYMENVINCVLGLWFTQPFFIAIDSELRNNLSTLERQEQIPKILTIGNHISELDWLFMSILAEKLNIFRYTYILIKEEVGRIPILGYLLRSFGHGFMRRSRVTDSNTKNKDIESLNKFSNILLNDAKQDPSLTFWSKVTNCSLGILCKLKIIKSNPGVNCLFFPEATIFCQNTYKSTLNFYEKSKENEEDFPGIFEPEYVLLPRPLGTAALISRLSKVLHFICDVTLLTTPFVPSTYDYCSLKDIFLCKAPCFSFCMIVNNIDVPTDISELSNKIVNQSQAFELPKKLDDTESDIKKKTTKILYNVFEKKNELIKKYAEGQNAGNFKTIEEFKQFVEENCVKVDKKSREYCTLKISSPYTTPIFAIPIFCLLLAVYLFFGKKSIFISDTINQKVLNPVVIA